MAQPLSMAVLRHPSRARSHSPETLSGPLQPRHIFIYKPGPMATPSPKPSTRGSCLSTQGCLPWAHLCLCIPVASWMRAEFRLRISRKEEEP